MIVDFGKRRGLLSHLALSAIVHHSSEHSVEDLVPVLEDAGFGHFHTGELGIMSLGFVARSSSRLEPDQRRGRKPPHLVHQHAEE